MLLLHRRTAASGDEAVAGMLQEIGPPVLLGGLTTFLGISPLILSNSTVFRTFFKMFLGIIVFGLGHGLVLMPVVLSLLGARASPGTIVGTPWRAGRPRRETAGAEEPGQVLLYSLPNDSGSSSG